MRKQKEEKIEKSKRKYRKKKKENIERKKKKEERRKKKKEKERFPSHFHFCLKILCSLASSSTTQNVVLSAQGKNERKWKWG